MPLKLVISKKVVSDFRHWENIDYDGNILLAPPPPPQITTFLYP